MQCIVSSGKYSNEVEAEEIAKVAYKHIKHLSHLFWDLLVIVYVVNDVDEVMEFGSTNLVSISIAETPIS